MESNVAAEPEIRSPSNPTGLPSQSFDAVLRQFPRGYTSESWTGNGTGVYNSNRIWMRSVPGRTHGARAMQIHYGDRTWKVEIERSWKDPDKARLLVQHQSGRGTVIQLHRPVTPSQVLRLILNATVGKVRKVQASTPTMTPLQHTVSEFGFRVYIAGAGRA